MLELDMHLTEDELLALRDRREGSFDRWKHLLGCRRCQSRFAFLGAFKSALKELKKEYLEPRREQAQLDFMLDALTDERRPADARRSSERRASDLCFRSVGLPAVDHPDGRTLRAYYRGHHLPEEVRSSVHRHVLGCERCMADILVFSRGEAKSHTVCEAVADVGEYFREHGAKVTYRPGKPRVVKPQLFLGLVNWPGTLVRFRVLAQPDESGNLRPGRERPEDRIEVMVKDFRVTITARREGHHRHLDIEVRHLGRRKAIPATAVSLEEDGRPFVKVSTDERGHASVGIPAGVPEFDLRVDGGWAIPVLIRFRT